MSPIEIDATTSIGALKAWTYCTRIYLGDEGIPQWSLLDPLLKNLEQELKNRLDFFDEHHEEETSWWKKITTFLGCIFELLLGPKKGY